MWIDGVVVIDGSKLENLTPYVEQSERFVVITRTGNDLLVRLWSAGIRHVVFEGDAPSTVQPAIIAAELRMPSPEPPPTLPVLDAASRRGRPNCSSGIRQVPRR